MSEQAHDETERLIQAFLSGEEQPLPADHRSGYVAVVGKPNVGKSTLVNALIGHKVAIISPKPQTTRRRILGILTREDAQVLFVDTPGVHEPKQALNRYMMREVDAALKDCDAILFVTDVSRLPTDDDRRVAERIARLPQPKLLAMNKADLLDPRDVVEHVAAHEALLPEAKTDAADGAKDERDEDERERAARDPSTIFDVRHAILTSGTRGDNLDKLLGMILKTLPCGPRYFPAGQFTDQNERFLAAEFVREQALRFLEQEVPHGIAVAIEEWQRRPNGMIYIAATVYVERESQKGILIGKGGEMLKKIGVNARKEIERELGAKVYLELWAKVRPGWRRDDLWVARLMGGSA
ncbi:MAG: GTPase Era [Thermoflexales bacterium]|nr:GTPase Era [Thermoflexales bacterium]MDW8351973.1 GTPase Era [Anaerolineae bacterium]